MNLYRQVNQWLTENYEPLGHWMYFNATPMFVGAVTMNSVPGVRIVQKFIDGSMKKELAFAIDMITRIKHNRLFPNISDILHKDNRQTIHFLTFQYRLVKYKSFQNHMGSRYHILPHIVNMYLNHFQ